MILAIVGTVSAALSFIELAPLAPWDAGGPVGAPPFAPGLSASLAVWAPPVLAIATALLTAWLGLQIGSLRLGLLAGLIVAVNPEMIIVARSGTQELVATFAILLSFACFVSHYQDRSRPVLLVGYAAVGISGHTSHPLALIGPLAIFLLFFTLTRERDLRDRWLSWSGLALLLTFSTPWHVLLDWRLLEGDWQSLIQAVRTRPWVPSLSSGEPGVGAWLASLGVTAAGFFPWSLVLPYALASALSRPLGTKPDHLWLLLALWVTAVLVLTAPPQLNGPHLALVMFPQMALLVANVWDEVIRGVPRAPSPRLLLAPALVVTGAAGLVLFATGRWMPGAASSWVAPLYTQAILAFASQAPEAFSWAAGALASRQAELAAACWFGSLGLAAALIQRHAAVGFTVLLALTTACVILLGVGKGPIGPDSRRPEGPAICTAVRPFDRTSSSHSTLRSPGALGGHGPVRGARITGC